MQLYFDTAIGKQYAFSDDVVVSGAPGALVFTAANGSVLGPYPATLVAGTAPMQPVSLAQAQAEQNAALTHAAAVVIIGGFSSSALGSPNHYPSKPTDQENLRSAALVAASAAAGWTTGLWCENAGGTWTLMQHTAAEVTQVHADFQAMVAATQAKLAAARASVACETTVGLVLAITW